MKRLIGYSLLAALGTIASAGPATAQTPASNRPAAASTSKSTIGVLGGLTIANLTLPLDQLPPEFTDLGFSITNGTRVGAIGGLFVSSPASGRLALETGAMVSVKGTAITITVPGEGTASGNLNLTYLDLPILAQIQLVRGTRGRFYLLTGPTIDVNLHASFSAAGQSESADGFPRMDYAWTVSGRYDMERLLFEVRYDHGLRNLAQDPGVTARNRSAAVMVGWKFGK